MNILIVDDFAPFRQFVRAILGDEGYLDIADAEDGESALVAAQELHPDWVILDIHLGPGLDGFDVARRLSEFPSPPKVVCVSSRERSAYGARVDAAAIQGFLPKDEVSVESLSALFDQPVAS